MLLELTTSMSSTDGKTSVKIVKERVLYPIDDVNVCNCNLSNLKETCDLGNQDVKLILFAIDEAQKRHN